MVITVSGNTVFIYRIEMGFWFGDCTDAAIEVGVFGVTDVQDVIVVGRLRRRVQHPRPVIVVVVTEIYIWLRGRRDLCVILTALGNV